MIPTMKARFITVLLNVGHTLDHMFLLIFATAVTQVAEDMDVERWEDLMPFGAAAFFFFGIGSLPAGKLGDQWGRRKMMLIFYIGIGLASMLVSQARHSWELAALLAVMGCFASIYHPVGIPMLMQYTTKPGWSIGVNGLMGNLGIAVAAAATGWLVKEYGWRSAFLVPGLFSLACGFLFWWVTDPLETAPAKNKTASKSSAQFNTTKLFFVMTLGATTGSLLFNFSTNSNNEVLASKLAGILDDPVAIGMLLAAVYILASFTQLIIGSLIDRMPLKRLYMTVVSLQLITLFAATQTQGWAFYGTQLLFMCCIFAAIPFADAMIVRYVDDSMRSRISGMRLAVSFSASSVAVWLIGPIIKGWGFTTFLWVMAITSAVTLAVISFLPTTQDA